MTLNNTQRTQLQLGHDRLVSDLTHDGGGALALERRAQEPGPHVRLDADRRVRPARFARHVIGCQVTRATELACQILLATSLDRMPFNYMAGPAAAAFFFRNARRATAPRQEGPSQSLGASCHTPSRGMMR